MGVTPPPYAVEARGERREVFQAATAGGAAMGSHTSPTVRIEAVTQTEGAEILDAASRRLLSLSGEEFLSRWERGDFISDDHVAVMKVTMLIPLAR
jgi:hypothetical protein